MELGRGLGVGLGDMGVLGRHRGQVGMWRELGLGGVSVVVRVGITAILPVIAGNWLIEMIRAVWERFLTGKWICNQIHRSPSPISPMVGLMLLILMHV